MSRRKSTPARRHSQAHTGPSPIIGDFFGSAVVPTASVGVPPTLHGIAPVGQSAIGNPLGRLAVKFLVKGDIVAADKVLREKWFCINIETRQKAKPYLESRLAVWMEKAKRK
jgi:hypothetical protein